MNFKKDNLYADLDKIHNAFIDCQAEHLTKYTVQYALLDIGIFNDDPIIPLVNLLCAISEELSHEEADNGGFSREARLLRVHWRKTCKSIERHMKKTIKGCEDYNREWSIPRTTYIFAETGEVHNGLWWTIKFTAMYLFKHKFWVKPMTIKHYEKKHNV